MIVGRGPIQGPHMGDGGLEGSRVAGRGLFPRTCCLTSSSRIPATCRDPDASCCVHILPFPLSSPSHPAPGDWDFCFQFQIHQVVICFHSPTLSCLWADWPFGDRGGGGSALPGSALPGSSACKTSVCPIQRWGWGSCQAFGGSTATAWLVGTRRTSWKFKEGEGTPWAFCACVAGDTHVTL